jgi:ankyrin repeat protein
MITPLHLACGIIFINIEVITCLLDGGADIAIENNSGLSPLLLIPDANIREEVREYANSMNCIPVLK